MNNTLQISLIDFNKMNMNKFYSIYHVFVTNNTCIENMFKVQIRAISISTELNDYTSLEKKKERNQRKPERPTYNMDFCIVFTRLFYTCE